jgi:hypothetical protein
MGTGAGIGEMRKTFKISIRKSERKRVLGRRRRRWEDNIRMDVRGKRVWLRIGSSGGML